MLHLLRWKVPDEIPSEMEEVCSDLLKCKDQSEAVRRAYEIVTSRFAVSRLHTYLRLGALMDKNLHRVWHRTEYLHCTHLNHLMKVLLVHSGWFHSRDIRVRWTLIWGVSPHQYLRIRLNDGSNIAADPWGRTYGVPFGKYVSGWNGSFKPVWKPPQSSSAPM